MPKITLATAVLAAVTVVGISACGEATTAVKVDKDIGAAEQAWDARVLAGDEPRPGGDLKGPKAPVLGGAASQVITRADVEAALPTLAHVPNVDKAAAIEYACKFYTVPAFAKAPTVEQREDIIRSAMGNPVTLTHDVAARVSEIVDVANDLINLSNGLMVPAVGHVGMVTVNSICTYEDVTGAVKHLYS